MADEGADSPLLVVKVGGSLYDLPDLGARLRAWCATLPTRKLLLVPGGGAAADAVRDLDRRHGLGEEPAHWLALEALALNARFLRHLVELPVLDPLAFAREDEGRPGCLPHSWDVTSDSVAARVAEVFRGTLILAKSADIPEGLSWSEAARRGLVDPYFPTLVARGVPARAVNLRAFHGNSGAGTAVQAINCLPR